MEVPRTVMVVFSVVVSRQFWLGVATSLVFSVLYSIKFPPKHSLGLQWRVIQSSGRDEPFVFRPAVRKLEDIAVTRITGVDVRQVIKSNNDWMEEVAIEHITMDPNSILAAHLHERANSYVMVEGGSGQVLLSLQGGLETQTHDLQAGSQIMVPAGTWHEVRAGSKGLFFYSLNHPPILRHGVHDVVHEHKDL